MRTIILSVATIAVGLSSLTAKADGLNYVASSDSVQLEIVSSGLREGSPTLNFLSCKQGGIAEAKAYSSNWNGRGSESIDTYQFMFRVSEFPCRPAFLYVDGMEISIPSTPPEVQPGNQTTSPAQSWGVNVMECVRPQLEAYKNHLTNNKNDLMKQNYWPGLENLDTLTVKQIFTWRAWLGGDVERSFTYRLEQCLKHFPGEDPSK